MAKTAIIIALIVLFLPAVGGITQTKTDPNNCVYKIEFFRYLAHKIYVVKSEYDRREYYNYISVGLVPPRKRVWMEIYIGDKNGIRLFKIIMAKVIPAQSEQWFFEDFNINDLR
ncbi:MAG: hypothetical protein PHC68_17510 [Syntrophorhabdaceae bacterium]|nr:hypothetical protein [Syntrophorhabdaceae bacterium]